VLGGRLYVVGGNGGDTVLHASTEEFDPVAGRWRMCASLCAERSGALAAAV
jgi:Kelch motif